MTTALLIMLVLIELARLALQYWQGKTYAKTQSETYCTTSETCNIRSKVSENDVQKELDAWAKLGYEIAAVTYSGYNKSKDEHYYTLFFTKKKIKSFTED